MKNRTLSVLCALLSLWGCATYKEGVPSSRIVQCPDGDRPLLDCRMAFDQYQRVLKFDIHVVDKVGTGLGLGAQSLISLDSITGDLLAHVHQVCVEYNHCLISREEYAREQKYLRRAQMRIRELTTTTSAKVTVRTSDDASEKSSSDPKEGKGDAPDVSMGEKINKAKEEKSVSPDTDPPVGNPVIFSELDSIESKMEALKKKQRSAGAGAEAALAAADGPQAAGQVRIEYALQARREVSTGAGGGRRYEPVPFTPGASLRSGDQFKISFMTDADGFVYVVNFDAAGNPAILFPHPEAGMDNKTRGGKRYEIPAAADRWYYLDQTKGQEVLYVIASPFQIPNLDSLVSELLQGKSGSRPGLNKARLRGSLEALTRGIGVTGDAGENQGTKRPSSAVVTERIEFRHD